MHKPILRRVGLVLLLGGLLELAWTIFEAIESRSFSFDFTLLAAAVALISGNLSVAHFIRRLAAFGVGAFLCIAVYSIATEPLSLFMARLHWQTLQTVGDLVSEAVTVVLLAWTTRELSRPEILSDAGNHSFAWITPRLAFGGGVAVCIVAGALLLPQAYGETGARALRDANARLGSSFHYHLSGLGIEYENGTKHVSGTVTAWNDSTVVELPFAWDE
jgi:hypothetical protein